jgi:hypothetical protein
MRTDKDCIMKTFRLLAYAVFSFTCSVAAAEPVSIDDESFGVFYETPMNTNKGLVLYIRNKNCFGSYSVSNNDLVIATGDINSRGPEKIIPFGTAKFRVDCGPQQSIVINRE